ncbi:MAG TPA: hypothetical protein VNG89_04700, partial [Vicinamibacterales bacterium]|nr:hypothetical protein [Vicinamibacterales bacterium]
NGARGVIINVTGGPDLSLVEVSEASSIVQEAADEDANIIFGAVVDPILKGKVKITVIATGFGGVVTARSSVSPATATTPVDMTQYAEHARVRSDSIAVAAGAAVTPRLSLARRSLVDLSGAAGGGAGTKGGSGLDELDAVQNSDASAPPRDADFDLGSTFDVPAFLRRQEG